MLTLCNPFLECVCVTQLLPYLSLSLPPTLAAPPPPLSLMAYLLSFPLHSTPFHPQTVLSLLFLLLPSATSACWEALFRDTCWPATSSARHCPLIRQQLMLLMPTLMLTLPLPLLVLGGAKRCGWIQVLSPAAPAAAAAIVAAPAAVVTSVRLGAWWLPATGSACRMSRLAVNCHRNAWVVTAALRAMPATAARAVAAAAAAARGWCERGTKASCLCWQRSSAGGCCLLSGRPQGYRTRG